MIKQSLLLKLKGMKVNMAEKLIQKAGHTIELVPEGFECISLYAAPNVIILWQEKGIVIYADARDPFDIEEDVDK